MKFNSLNFTVLASFNNIVSVFMDFVISATKSYCLVTII